jgi:hypothetical protein
VTSPRHGSGTIARENQDNFAILEVLRAEEIGLVRTETTWKKECDVTTKFGGKRRRGLATGVPVRRPARLHYVVVRDGDKGLDVLRVPLRGKGGALPVFSAGWAARGYLFAEAPGGGWYVRACTPEELVSQVVGCCSGVEWVMLDPRPGRLPGMAANLMPWENFVDYLLA